MSDSILSPRLMDPDALAVVRCLQQHRYIAYVVGGSIRDLLIGRTPKDFDVSTSAMPWEIRRLFPHSRIIGRRFRLVHVVFQNRKVIETSTFRKTPPVGTGVDDEPADLLIRRDNVYGTPEEDALRRDFTVNGIFYDPVADRIIDFVDGLQDIQARVLRTIGDPDVRFQEDPVRILRALRFAAKLQFSIEPQTWRFMQAHHERIRLSAPRRVLDETWKLLLCGAARPAMELARQVGVLQLLAPEIAPALENGNTGPVMYSLLDMFDAEPPIHPALAQVMMAPILLYAHLEPLWESFALPWPVRMECFDFVNEQVDPLLNRYGFSRMNRARVRDLLLFAMRIGHPEKPERVHPRLRRHELFSAACQLWRWIWRARRTPEELLDTVSCDSMQPRSEPSTRPPRRRRRRKNHRKPEEQNHAH